MRENLLKVESSERLVTMKLGNIQHQVTEPGFIYGHEDLIHALPREISGYVETRKIRATGKNVLTEQSAKGLTRVMGITPTKWIKVYNYHVGKAWVQPIKEYEWLLRGYRGRFVYHRIKDVWENKNLLDQVRNDGLEHLLPIVLLEGASPAELRKKYGKGAWKKICANSKSRNRLIYQRCSNYRVDDAVHIWNKIPTTVLRVNHFIPSSGLFWAIENRQTPLKDRWSIRRLSHIYADTQSMADRLGEPFNPKWGLRRMQEQHNLYTDQISARCYSDDPFGYEQNIVENRDFKATLLLSPKEVAEEGMRMRHCVSMYIPRCSKGNYQVYSITKDGQPYSTLGLVKNDDCWQIDQHYKACNERVDNEKALQLARKVVAKVNVDFGFE